MSCDVGVHYLDCAFWRKDINITYSSTSQTHTTMTSFAAIIALNCAYHLKIIIEKTKKNWKSTDKGKICFTDTYNVCNSHYLFIRIQTKIFYTLFSHEKTVLYTYFVFHSVLKTRKYIKKKSQQKRCITKKTKWQSVRLKKALQCYMNRKHVKNQLNP